ncbi:MAG TPA: hypothetical protein VK436_02265 [Methanocella sp.]|nr:hypothetical protein [Methanocella sp.]
MNLIQIAGIAIVLIVIAVMGGMIFVSMDIMSHLATGNETLSPAGTPTGRALVVYDPGVSGAAKSAAVQIARNLQSKGYTIDLAGVNSESAGNTYGYDVIAVGGPTYGGVPSRSITAFLKALKPTDDAKVGVFATGGFTWNRTAPWYEQDKISITEGVSGIWEDSSLSNPVAIEVIRGDKVDRDSSDFVAAMLREEKST